MKKAVVLGITLATLLAGGVPLALAAVGTRAPEFILDSAPGGPTSGRFRLSDHLGQRPIVLLFWSTTCRPCMQELPVYQQLFQRYGNRLMVVGISTDGPDTVAEVGATARQLGLTFPIVVDAETQVVASYQPRVSLPFSVWIDINGNIVREREGFSMSETNVINAGIARLVNARRR